jgi:hypothetical protein
MSADALYAGRRHEKGHVMVDKRTARSRGHDIEVTVDDDGTPSVVVDGESVPVRIVDGRYAVAYLQPVDDLLDGARKYVSRID